EILGSDRVGHRLGLVCVMAPPTCRSRLDYGVPREKWNTAEARTGGTSIALFAVCSIGRAAARGAKPTMERGAARSLDLPGGCQGGNRSKGGRAAALTVPADAG